MFTFYHGSATLFNRFDLSHILEGDGKVKFEYGVYLTSSFKSCSISDDISKIQKLEFREIAYKMILNQNVSIRN